MLEEEEGRPISKTLLNVNACPIKPMLASPLPDDRTIEDYDPKEWVLEEKYDGHRLIVDTRTLKAWSRVGNERVLPTQILDAMRGMGLAILDCEILVPSGTATDVKDLGNESRLILVVFDLLKDGDTSLLETAQADRRLLLEKYLPSRTSVVSLAPQEAPSSAALERIWARGGEGAILKRKAAHYFPMKRSKDWVKFKKFESFALRVTGFESGKLGNYSVILLEDERGVTCSVKAKNDRWREEFSRNAKNFEGQILMIECQGRTDTSYRSPMADFFLQEGLMPYVD
jgi:ATP-dependent DNA ligase